MPTRVLGSLILIQLATILSVGAQGRHEDVGKALGLFPGYHLLKLEERDPDTRAYLSGHFGKTSSSIVHADFDGDGHADYALLLKSDKTPKTRIVVLLCQVTGSCKTVYDLDLTGSAGEVYLKRVPAGSRVSQTDAIDSNENVAPVRLTAAGIRVSYFEKAEVVLCWDRKLKKIVEIQTGD